MKNAISNIIHLLKHQLKLEWKSPYIIGANLLYVVTTVFITYKVFNKISPPTWSALFWVIFMFVALNITIHSYTREQSKSVLFYYSILHPIELFVTRTLFNFIFLLLTALLLYLVMTIFLISPIVDFKLFFLVLTLSSLAFSIIFSFTSAIAVHTGMRSTIMTILSLPLVLPVILTAVKLTLVSGNVIMDDGTSSDIMILSSINLIMLGIAVILFPYLWRS